MLLDKHFSLRWAMLFLIILELPEMILRIVFPELAGTMILSLLSATVFYTLLYEGYIQERNGATVRGFLHSLRIDRFGKALVLLLAIDVYIIAALVVSVIITGALGWMHMVYQAWESNFWLIIFAVLPLPLLIRMVLVYPFWRSGTNGLAESISLSWKTTKKKFSLYYIISRFLLPLILYSLPANGYFFFKEWGFWWVLAEVAVKVLLGVVLNLPYCCLYSLETFFHPPETEEPQNKQGNTKKRRKKR